MFPHPDPTAKGDPAQPVLDLAAVHEELSRYHDAPGLVCVWSVPSKRSYTFATDNASLVAAAQRIRDLDVQGEHSIYVQGTTLARDVPAGRRGSNDNVAAYMGVQFDVDYGKVLTPEESAKDPRPYAPDLETVLRLLDKADLPRPTVTIGSGHGVYPRWDFAEPSADMDGARRLALDMAAEIRRVFDEAGYRLDRHLGKDPARVWRVPGTVNRKAEYDQAVPCRVLRNGGPHHRLAELRAAVHGIDQSEGSAPASGSRLVRADGGHSFSDEQARSYVAREAWDRLRDARHHVDVNDSLNEASVVVGHFVRDWYEGDAASAALRVAQKYRELVCRRYGWPDLDETDVATIRSGLTHGAQEPYTRRKEMPADEVFGAPGAPEGSSWAAVDLGPYLRGEVERPRPSVGATREDGLCFLYPGREHACIGEMESGKSWFAIACAAAELRKGNRVEYIHFEEADPQGTVDRLVGIGVSVERIQAGFTFRGPETPITADIVDEIRRVPPSLVILDGQNEAMALHGQEIREEKGPAEYRRKLVKPFTAMGAAVLSLDHVVKDKDQSRNGYALGSIMKGNGLSGSLILLEGKDPFGQGRKGASHVFVTKDRPGSLRTGGRATGVARKFYMGTLVVDGTGGEVALRLTVPPDELDPDDDFGAAALRRQDEAVFAALQRLEAADEPATQQQVYTAARESYPLRKEAAASSLLRLNEAGRVKVRLGARGSKIYTTCSREDQ
jgi:hypothetical protein